MKKATTKLFWFICAVLMMATTTFTSCGDDDDDVTVDNKLKIVNLSGYDFESVFMSPSSMDTWTDILDDDDVLMDEETLNIELLKSKNQKWDIRLCQDVLDIENGYIEFKNLNLTGISTITIIQKEGGDLYYVLQ